MNGGNIALAITVAASLVAILSWLGFRVNGPHIVARVKTRIERPRAEREALNQRISALEEDLGAVTAIVGKEMELRDAIDARLNRLETLAADPAQGAVQFWEGIRRAPNTSTRIGVHTEQNPLADYPPRSPNSTEP